MAGFGAAVNTGGVQRGDSVAVFGCGGVGDAAIAGRSLVGARTIIAVDVDARKLELARGVRRHAHRGRLEGGRRSRRSASSRTATAPTSCIEAVGRPDVLEQAFYARDLAGTVVQVGVPDPGHGACPTSR